MITQINLQTHFGGGEVYTAFLCRALSHLGIATRLIVHADANFWDTLNLPADTHRLHLSCFEDIRLSDSPGWLLGHGPLPQILVARAKAAGWRVTAIAHMPVQDRNPEAFAGHDMIFAVSGWVREGLIAAGLPVWPVSLYGVADIHCRAEDDIRRTSRYDWDRRKFRDRLLSWLEPAIEPWRPHPCYKKRQGLTLGIVSRITPIKQFPQMFRLLAPVLAEHPDVSLEIFGCGGYASVRDLTRSLAPIIDRVRFWGQQRNVAVVYRSLDYLMTGLPEKEALGLNVIEAQFCGTPVLAPRAPPFMETVVEGATGFFYTDPRKDGGVDFGRLLSTLRNRPRPDPKLAREHLARFSFDTFVERLRPVVCNLIQSASP